MGEPILSVRGLTKHFGGVVALKDLSFDVGKGEVVGLMGPNGAGKTTLLNIIAGEYAPDVGSITYKGTDISGLSPHKICHLGIGRTYQIPQPFVSLTVEENLLVATIFGRQMKKRMAKIEDQQIFDLVDLTDKKDILAGSLPVLALKKLELARVLARRPDVILLDEVAAGSTELEIPKFVACMQEIRKMGITVVIIEHIMKVLMNVVDRIVVIDKGEKIADGEPNAIMCDKKVIDAYFGT
jgi:branched-chain amino acid transport system ATP-binding protein